MKKIQYLKDVLKAEHIHKMLKEGPGITIVVAPTGTGKSTSIMEDIIMPQYENDSAGFGTQAKYSPIPKMNFALLMNRTAVKMKTKADYQQLQNSMGLHQAEGVQIESYQKVIDKIAILEEADAIIGDEIHYFISDAWNGITNGLLKKFFELSEKKPVIAFTATPELFIEALRTYGMSYTLYDFTDTLGFNDRMSFVATNKSLEQIVKEIPAGEKWIAFEFDEKSRTMMHNRADRMIEDGYTVTVYHSTWDKEKDGSFKHRVNKEMAENVRALIGMKKFDTMGAIANKAIDNGIDLKDDDLKHIILINQSDHVQIKQYVGRKRFDTNNPDDKVKIWFTTDGNSQLKKHGEQMFKRNNIYRKYRQHHELQSGYITTVFNNPSLSKGKTPEQLKAIVNDTVYSEFVHTNENGKIIDEVKLTQELMQNEVYGHLLKAQLAYIDPLTRQVQYDENEGLQEPDVVRNYSNLAQQLFGKSASIQWRNKDIAATEREIELKQRYNDELPNYLKELLDVDLFLGSKQKFEAEISFYYGASSRKGYAKLGKINEFIAELGYYIDKQRKTIEIAEGVKEKKIVWTIKQKL